MNIFAKSDIGRVQDVRATVEELKQRLTSELDAMPIGEAVNKQTAIRVIADHLQKAEDAIICALLTNSLYEANNKG